MSAVIFLGPSLPLAQARALLPAEYLPPAAQGDVYRVASRRRKPHVIGLIDGRFESVPAVRHKEILWAMAEGIHVFGAASLGALRAAELHPFGMVGVGRIFAAFRDGIIEDDDEVAVEHGPAAVGHLALSEPMVNIRATLEAAVSEGVIDTGIARQLTDLAKRRFYKLRSQPALLADAAMAGLPEPTMAALAAWLPEGRVDLKADDAVALLGAVRDHIAGTTGPLVVDYRFESTEAWQQDVESAAAAGAGAESVDLPAQAILDELRLVPGAYEGLVRDTLALALAEREAKRQNLAIDDAAMAATADRLHRRYAADGPEALGAWLAANDLDEPGFTALASLQAVIERIAEIASPLVDRHLIDMLRLSGRYPDLALRARRKLQAVEGGGLTATDSGRLGLGAQALARWYFSRRLGCPAPDDIERFAAEQGFAAVTDFYAALAREYVLVEGATVAPE